MKISELDDRFESIKLSYEKSAEKINRLSLINAAYEGTGVCLAITGSLARKELTFSSDFDAYVITRDDNVSSDLANSLWKKAVDTSELKHPSADGSFGADQKNSVRRIINNIGGNKDSNKKITQRILLILESFFVGDQKLSNELTDKIISRYIADEITNHQLGMFLLNDIIRFYRTMCVDFEYKTIESGKSWGVRNIKLVYSRKLIYFAGIIMCAELAQASAVKKREICKTLMAKSPIERILHILGADAIKPLIFYNNFLSALSDDNIRAELEGVKSNKRNGSVVFTDLKNQGHHFAWALRSAFNHHYDATHPIHRALMF